MSSGFKLLTGGLGPVPAKKAGDVWTLDLPMSEGRYSWAWQVDGKTLDGMYNGQTASGVRVVQPEDRLQTPAQVKSEWYGRRVRVACAQFGAA